MHAKNMKRVKKGVMGVRSVKGFVLFICYVRVCVCVCVSVSVCTCNIIRSDTFLIVPCIQ